MMNIRFAHILFGALAIVLLSVGVARAEIISEHGPWAASKLAEGDNLVCHISAKPEKDEGDYTRRGDIFAIVTHRPAEDTVGEVSIQAGYTYKEGSSVTITIDDGMAYNLFTKGGYAWTRERAADRALVKAMRGGLKMVVKGTSARGTLTTDTYSLSGFTAAYNAISQACGVK